MVTDYDYLHRMNGTSFGPKHSRMDGLQTLLVSVETKTAQVVKPNAE